MRKSVWIETLPGGYKVRWYAKDPSGKWFKDGQWFERLAEAQRHQANKKLSLLSTAQGQTDPTLKPIDLFHDYLDSLALTHRESTITLKTFALKTYLYRLEGLDKLSPKSFYSEMVKEKYSVSTISIRLRELRAFCSWMVKEKYLSKSPFTEFSIPASLEVGRKIELPEIQKIWEVAPPAFRLYLAFLIYTGARRNEIKAAEWRDIDFTRNIWTIPRENTKTKKERKIPLDAALLDLLRGIVVRTGRIFPQNNLNRSLKLAVRRAGIQGRVRIHDFRHTYASHWTGDPRKLMDKLGWTTMAMLKRYSHFNIEDIRQESEQKGIAASLTLAPASVPVVQTVPSIREDDVRANS